jgi:hypothetical protein
MIVEKSACELAIQHDGCQCCPSRTSVNAESGQMALELQALSKRILLGRGYFGVLSSSVAACPFVSCCER